MEFRRLFNKTNHLYKDIVSQICENANKNAHPIIIDLIFQLFMHEAAQQIYNKAVDLK